MELYTNSLISSPLLIGFFHPCIVLPTAEPGETVYFDSESGSLIAQGLSQGKLPIADASAQPAPSAVQPSTDNSRFTLARKVYTVSDLQALGISGVCVEAQTEQVVVRQGGDALIFEYDQADDQEYTLETGQYELYHEEYMTPEEFAAHGKISGMVTQLELCRASEPKPGEAARTIYITLPADPQYSLL